jgi:SAM-dependent methyltransferase
MKWLAKAGVQGVLSVVPKGADLNYQMQVHVTKSLPRPLHPLAFKAEEGAKNWRLYTAADPAVAFEEATLFEFGAGWDLIIPITYWALGARRQILVDIDDAVRIEQVNHALRTIAEHCEYLEERIGASLRPVDPTPIRHVASLQQRMGIEYRAPVDARDTGLGDASVDLVTSTHTMEHIPADVIAGILREARRILKPTGMLSSVIDLKDHYSYFEPRLSPYNFLRYSDRRWRWLSPSLQYQNRLRHSDYRKLFERAGLSVVSEDVLGGAADELAHLRRTKLAARFDGYEIEDLAVQELSVIVAP